jgi:RES domain-containing protein
MLSIAIPRVSYIHFDHADLLGADASWASEGNRTCRNLGNHWLDAQTSCALVVPSAANHADHNILFNPAHPEFSNLIRANSPIQLEPFTPEERVVAMVEAYRARLGS